MNTKVQYRFNLTTDSGTSIVTPIYGDDMTKVYEQEPNQVFFREKLNGNLIFMRDDYDLINDAAFDHEFTISIDRRNTSGIWVNDWFKGIFTKTDCEFDEDQKRIEVQPEANDQYKKIIEGMNKEYDLIDVKPETTELSVKLQPLVQIYIIRTGVVTNVLSGTQWEEQTNFIEGNDLTIRNDYKFGDTSNINIVPGASGANLDPDVSGTYEQNTLIREGDAKYQFVFQNLGSGDQWTIIDLTDSNNVVYTAPVGAGLGDPNPFLQGALFTSETSSSQCRMFQLGFYARLLTNLDTISGNPTFDIPEDDLVPAKSNYTKVYPLDNYTGFTAHDGNSSTPDRWGRFIDDATNFADLYFNQPVFDPSSNIGQLFPVHRSEWTEYSIWFYYTLPLRNLQVTGAEDRTYKQVYKLGHAISALLENIDSSVVHELTSEYSDFFYSFSGNPIRDGYKIPMISPKSNFVKGEYDQPSGKAIIKLSDIFDLLRYFHQVYWFIEDNKLKLEHIDFFDRGKTYTGQNVEYDLTSLLEPKTKKPWAYKTSKYKFDKSDMPAQIKHSWMDTSSELFEGFPIEILSNYIEKGNFKENSISLFTSDVDFVFGQPESISLDGFMFFEAWQGEGIVYLPFVTIELDYPNEYKSQNANASIVYAHATYWTFNLPASSINLNLADDTADTVQRRRIQDIQFGSEDEPDPMKLLTSNLGTGKIQKMELAIISNDIKMTIKHETE